VDSSSSLPELVLPDVVEESPRLQDTSDAVVTGPSLQQMVEETNEDDSMEAVVEPNLLQEVLPDEDVIDTASVGSDGLPFVDVDKVFDVDVEPYEESEEERKQELAAEENKYKTVADSSPATNLDSANQDKPAFEDSDPELDLDVRGRTSSLGGGVVRSWPTNEAGIPLVVPELGKRTFRRKQAPRKRYFPPVSRNLH
jgi:hypothetical protein